MRIKYDIHTEVCICNNCPIKINFIIVSITHVGFPQFVVSACSIEPLDIWLFTCKFSFFNTSSLEVLMQSFKNLCRLIENFKLFGKRGWASILWQIQVNFPNNLPFNQESMSRANASQFAKVNTTAVLNFYQNDAIKINLIIVFILFC